MSMVDTTSGFARQATNQRREVRVWDSFIRIFHWSLVVAFAVAYFSAEDGSRLHEWAGYLVAVLIGARIVWGFIGSRHARFGDFVRRPSEVLGYARRLLTGRARRTLGHNPLGGIMVLLLLGSLLGTSLTGMMLLGAEEQRGPLASAMAAAPAANPVHIISPARADDDDDKHERDHNRHEWIEGLHEVFANFTVFLVVLHIAGVLIGSALHRENLIGAMITGRKHV